MNRRILAVFFVTFAVTTSARAEVSQTLAISPASPTANWQVTLAAKASARVTVEVAVSGQANGRTYTLKSDGIPTASFTKSGTILWAGPESLPLVGTKYSGTYTVVNTATTPQTTTVKVICKWGPQADSGGGGGNGGAGSGTPAIPPDISGLAQADAILTIGSRVTWGFTPRSQGVGKTINWSVEVADANGSPDATVTGLTVSSANVDPGTATWTVNNGTTSPGSLSGTLESNDPSTGNLKAVYSGGTGSPNTADATLTFLKLVLKDGTTTVNENGYVYITDVPRMPELKSFLMPANLSNDARWKLHIAYTRNRDDHTYCPGPDASAWKTILASSPWDMSEEFSGTCRGGKATVYCEYDGLLSTVVFHIRGTNPTEAAVEQELGVDPWYAIPIVKWESDRTTQGRYYAQFNTVGKLGPEPKDYRSCPSYGPPNGWGVCQLDPPSDGAAGMQELWNWKVNVAEGKKRLASCRVDASTWIAKQEEQQKAEEPGMPLENYSFKFGKVTFQKGTNRTPIDACTIQRYNGAAKWVIFWKNKTNTEPGSWQIRGGDYREYVDNVCSQVP
jgi:hypothetical protein